MMSDVAANAPGPSSALLEVENLEVVYARVILAAQGVSLRVPRRGIVALLGTNGAGKTTTVRAITGFLPADDARIRKGSIVFDGHSIIDRPPYEVARRGVVLVPERHKIFETMTVWDNLRIARGRAGSSADWQQQIDRLFALFPILAARKDQISGYMSGGERQMLAIAQAVLCRPRLLVIDEMSLGLAPHLVAELMRAVAGLRDAFDLSILLIEQDAIAALGIADQGYIMEGGKIVYEGTAEKLRGHKDVQEFYLGSGDAGRTSYANVKQYRRSRRWWG